MDEETRPGQEIKQTITLPCGGMVGWLGDPNPVSNLDTTTRLVTDSDDGPILDAEQQALHDRLLSPGAPVVETGNSAAPYEIMTDADGEFLNLTRDMLVEKQEGGVEAAGTIEALDSRCEPIENSDTAVASPATQAPASEPKLPDAATANVSFSAVSAMLMPEGPSFFRRESGVTDSDASSAASANATSTTASMRPIWFNLRLLTKLLPTSLPRLPQRYAINIAACVMVVLSGLVVWSFVPKTEKSEPLVLIETTPSSKTGLRLVGDPDKFALGIDQHIEEGVGKRLTEAKDALQAQIDLQQVNIGNLQAQLTTAQNKIKALEEDNVRLYKLVQQLNESNINADDVVAALGRLRKSPGS